jgi:hypothetical protein
MRPVNAIRDEGEPGDVLDSSFTAFLAAINAILDIGVAIDPEAHRAMVQSSVGLAEMVLREGRDRVDMEKLPKAIAGGLAFLGAAYIYVKGDLEKAEAINDLTGGLGGMLKDILGGDLDVSSGPGGIGLIIKRG